MPQGDCDNGKQSNRRPTT
uniref:Uncharacterized protein n=1 Tax=Anguilla anguilla TaxID=7936 RepID=A0A0E9VI57_ANGAN